MRVLTFFLAFHLSLSIGYAQDQNISINGLHDEVEIIVDHWGVPHIYANNEHDLFFAQGWHAAKDRLFQFEIWRRQATGTTAEIFGERELERDRGARLFRFRGDIDQEMNHYHPKGKEIIEAYVAGVNAFVQYVNEHPEELPLEFKLLGIEPKAWTPHDVVSRHQGLLGNIDAEIETVKAVHLLGEKKVKELKWFHPFDPDLSIDPAINVDLIMEEDVIAPYHAFRARMSIQKEDIITAFQNSGTGYQDLALQMEADYKSWQREDLNTIGSNNWVIDGSRTESGYPIMANDPHRRQSVPSLRYMSHLVAPGWNVIGGGEPEIPGISIGHNEHGAWGLTVYRTDAEDLYVYDIHPDDEHLYKYQGRWERMQLIQDTIAIKGSSPAFVTHAYTRHGPVTKIDKTNHVAYALRCGWLEIGGSPYLASLRMDQARTWEEFREACHYSNIPGENMIWMDRDGNIGWQAVGIAPIRPNFSGLIPVAGDGRYEWAGYIPIKAKPSIYNPENGIINTSNENVTPLDYEYPDVVSYEWSDPYRGDRALEVLRVGRSHSMSDMVALQIDYLSIPARQITPLFKHLQFDNKKIENARRLLLDWDFKLEPNSIAAGIYHELEKQIRKEIEILKVPLEARKYIRPPMKRVIQWLYMPDGEFGNDPILGRDQLLRRALQNSMANLEVKLGSNMDHWQYGQSSYKHIKMRHPLSAAVNDEIREKLEVGPAPRGGNSFTLNNTGTADNQPSGGSFKIIVDAEDWDECLATNTPGQNGNPDHPHYRNLFDLWARDQYFPLFYSREKVEGVAAYKLILTNDDKN